MPPLARPTRPRQPASAARAGGAPARRAVRQAPRTDSTSARPAEAAANAPSPKASSGSIPVMPPITQQTTTATPMAAGTARRPRMTSADDLRHGRAGATAIRNSRPRPSGDDQPVEVGGADGHLGAAVECLVEEGEHRAEQDDEGEQHEQEVVGQEGAFAAEGRVDAAGRAQPVAPPGDEADPDGQDQAEEPQQQRPDGRGREGVHRLDDPRSGQEGAEDGEAEGGDDQGQVPHPQQAPALLDHDRVEVGGADQPRHATRRSPPGPRPRTRPSRAPGRTTRPRARCRRSGRSRRTASSGGSHPASPRRPGPSPATPPRRRTGR